MRKADPLYKIFEQHLFNALVEDESADELVDRVVQEYLAELAHGGSIPPESKPEIAADLKDEVVEMFRKKTYGHYSLAEYRKSLAARNAAHSDHAPQIKTPARGRRSS